MNRVGVLIAVLCSTVASASARPSKHHKHHPRVEKKTAPSRPATKTVSTPATTSSSTVTVTPTPTAIPAKTPPPAPRLAASTPHEDSTVSVSATAPPTDGPPPGSLELLSIELDGGVGARDLAFGPGAVAGQRPHSAPVVALLGFHASLYPFARSHTRFLDGLGITASFLHSVGAQSAVDGVSGVVDARWSAFDIGVHERIRLGRHPLSPWVGVSLAFGRLAWSFESDGRLVGDLPSVDYRYLRPGLDLRFPFGPVTLAFAGGYRGILSGGYLDDRFGSEVRHGADATAAISVNLPRGFRVGVRGEYVHVIHTASSDTTQPAAGAVDRYASGTLLLAWAPR
jgi:hypothetical protein